MVPPLSLSRYVYPMCNTVFDGPTRTTARRAPHQNYFTSSTPDNSTNMSSIEAALAAIESLEPGERFHYAQIAKQHRVVRSTLTRRHQGLSTSRATQAQNQQTLYPQQELELLRYIERLTRQGLPLTRAMMRNFASQIAQREVGIH